MVARLPVFCSRKFIHYPYPFLATFAQNFVDAMLRQCTALLLLLAFAASTFSKAVIVVDFYANQDYIAKTLCENRDKPQMHCCGRCQLRKRLAHEDSQDKNNPERKSDDKREVLYSEDIAAVTSAPNRTCTVNAYPSARVTGPVDRSKDIFHPPA
jgi:hypothetical protein